LICRNYLLSGDPRMESAKANDTKVLASTLRDAREKTMTSSCAKSIPPSNRINKAGRTNSRAPDCQTPSSRCGQTTVSDLQIVYLQRSSNNLVEKSVSAMDDAERGIQKAYNKSEDSANTSASISNIVLSLGTFLGAPDWDVRCLPYLLVYHPTSGSAD